MEGWFGLRTSVITVLLLLSCHISAQTDSLKNKLNISLDFMTHGEVCGGGLPKDDDKVVEDHSAFLLGRLRLNVGYERRWLEMRAVIQNKAVWGTESNVSLNLYEAWARMSSRIGLFAQVGRVALSYDDERIVGPNDFAMAALSHDVLRLGYEGHGHQVHAVLAYNQNSSNVYATTYYDIGAQPYKTMQLLWYHYDVPKFPLGASLLFMNTGLQAGVRPDEVGYANNPARTVYQQMIGGYVKYHPKFMTLEGSYYRQIGKEVDDIKEAGNIDAWMASVKATIHPSDKYGFEVGYDYLSGDDYVPVIYGGMFGMVRHAVNKGFHPIYGSHSKFYGILDYFYASAYTNGFTPGLQNAFIGAQGKPTAKLACRVIYHYVATATRLRNLGRTLGHAIDLQASYTFTKDISLTAGYTQMLGTETMDRLKQSNGSKHAQWGWFSLVISPSLFTTKW